MSKGNRPERYSDIDERRGGVEGMSVKKGLRNISMRDKGRNPNHEVIDRTIIVERRTKQLLKQIDIFPDPDDEM